LQNIDRASICEAQPCEVVGATTLNSQVICGFQDACQIPSHDESSDQRDSTEEEMDSEFIQKEFKSMSRRTRKNAKKQSKQKETSKYSFCSQQKPILY